MIRFELKEEPPTFDEKVRKKGQAWLAKHRDAKPSNGGKSRLPSHWLAVREDLADAFMDLCAYTCMWLSHDGEVDHFISSDEDDSQAYEWKNYRYAAGWVNKSKKNLRSSQILDPFQVEDGWFELLLPSLQLVLTETCPMAFRERATFMLNRLQLCNGPSVMRSRRAFYAIYLSRRDTDPTFIDWLDNKAPLLARAIRKQEASGA